MKNLILSFLILCYSLSYAQDRINREQPLLSKPIATLNKTKGWKFDTYTGKWGEGFKNSIISIDEFDDLSFYVVDYKGIRYLDLIKTEDVSGFKYPSIQAGGFSYGRKVDLIIDLEEYNKQVSQLKSEGEISVSLKYFNENGRTEDLIIYEKLSQGDFMRIKYKIDEVKNTARFLIFVIDDKTSHAHLKLKGLNNLNTLQSGDIYKIINDGDMFNNFYYECKLGDFLKFIKAPLSL